MIYNFQMHHGWWYKKNFKKHVKKQQQKLWKIAKTVQNCRKLYDFCKSRRNFISFGIVFTSFSMIFTCFDIIFTCFIREELARNSLVKNSKWRHSYEITSQFWSGLSNLVFNFDTPGCNFFSDTPFYRG